MIEQPKPAVGRRRLLQGMLGAALIALAIWAAWFLTSGGFNSYVRGRVIAGLEQLTGGKVELAEFKWNLSELQFEGTNLTIHGLEKADEMPPYAHADRIVVRAKIISFFQREIGLRQVTLEHPVIHIIVYPDGSTNQPSPRTNPQRARESIQDLFDLAIEKTEVRDGMLIWNHRQIPLDFTANNFGAEMSYAAVEKRFDGKLSIGKFDTKIQEYRTFASHAEAEFSLYTSRADIKSLDWTSGRSHIHATAVITDFNDPRVAISYRGIVDGGDAFAVLRVREIRSGMADIEGKANYFAGGVTGSGKIQASKFELSVGGIGLHNVAANSDFAFDPKKLSFTRIFAHVLNGAAQGEITVRDWLHPRDGIEKFVPGVPLQQGMAELKISGVPVSAIVQTASSKRFPLENVHLAGTTDGTVRAEWSGSLRRLKTAFDLKVLPPENASENDVPVHAEILGTYYSGNSLLELDGFTMRTPQAEASASGKLGSASADLKLNVKAASIAEFRPLIDAIYGPGPLPVELAGAVAFNGTASGRFDEATVAGHLEVLDFTTAVENSAIQSAVSALADGTGSGAKSGQQKIHWDSFAGDVRYSPTQLTVNHGELRHGSATFQGDVALSLNKEGFNGSQPWAGRINMRGLDLTELQSIAGLHYPLKGSVNTNVQFAGTPDSPRLAGHLSLDGGNVYGQPAKGEADFALQNQQLQIRNASASGDAGQITGTGDYNLKSEIFKFEIRGTDFKLSAFPQLQIKRNRIEGLARFEARGAGSIREPVIDGTLNVTNVYLNGDRIGDVTAEAKTQGEDLRLSAVSSFQNARFSLDGNIKLRGDLPAQLDVKFGNIDLNPLIKSYLQDRITGHTTIAGTLRLVGPLRRPKDLNGEITVDQFLGNLENIDIHNDGPLRATMQNEILRIERFRLVGEQTHFIEASGTAELGGAQHLHLNVAGKLSLKLLKALSPDLTANGTSDFGVTIAGTLKKPAVNGRVQISDGSISYVDLPNGLSGINGSMVFNQDRLQVESLTARTGGGDLVLGGFITYDRAITFNLTARGHDIRLRYPPGISSTADADLTLAGTLKNSLLSGEITVTKFGVSPRFDFGSYLEKSKQPVQIGKSDSPLNGLRFDVHVVSTPELELQTSLAKVTGDVDLRLRGTAARPSVLGRVNIVEGDVSFNGTQYHLERGDITFTNPVRIEPILDLEASARVRDYDITLGLHGPTDKVQPTFRSDPPLPEGDIIALLALGRTREETAYTSMNSQQSQNFGQTAGGALLGQALNATVSSRVQKLFGVSRIKIDPQVGGPENNPNARLTVEQSVSNKFTVTYITNLSQSAQQIIQVEYNINKNVSIVGNRDQNGVVGFDVRVRQRKK